MSSVVPIHGHQLPEEEPGIVYFPEKSEQSTFEGMPVIRGLFRLKGSKQTPTERVLHIGENIEVRSNCRVVGIEHDETGEGSVSRVHVIEVLEARLD